MDDSASFGRTRSFHLSTFTETLNNKENVMAFSKKMRIFAYCKVWRRAETLCGYWDGDCETKNLKYDHDKEKSFSYAVQCAAAHRQRTHAYRVKRPTL